MDLTYHVVDVFTKTPLEGNALAVFPDASTIGTETMQRIARELNLSETAFILPAESRDGETRVRIFTPRSEMAFAGHPTIGTAYVMRRLAIVPHDAARFALDENIGRVNVRVGEGDDPILWLTTPPIHELASFPARPYAAAFSLEESDLLPNVPCELLSAGNPSLFVAVRDSAAVDRASLDTARFLPLLEAHNNGVCAFIFAPTPQGAYSRMFAPHLGVPEDPATGSATGPLAAFMMKHGLAPGAAFISEQGTRMGRRSILHVLVHGENGCDGIEVGGNVTHVATARLTFGS